MKKVSQMEQAAAPIEPSSNNLNVSSSSSDSSQHPIASDSLAEGKKAKKTTTMPKTLVACAFCNCSSPSDEGDE